MKKIFSLALVLIFLLTSCDVWNVQPQPFPAWTALPSRTPEIVSPTPIILTQTFTETPLVSVSTTFTPTYTETPSISPTYTPEQVPPSPTFTITSVQSAAVDILGCNTSIDITHGMGEVTNAFIVLKNSGTIDLPNTCALLRAIDEDREHPDKKACITNLPVQNQVTLKLTVDSAYKQETAIQVDVTSNELLLLRVDKTACTDISLFGGAPSEMGIIKPIQP